MKLDTDNPKCVNCLKCGKYLEGFLEYFEEIYVYETKDEDKTYELCKSCWNILYYSVLRLEHEFIPDCCEDIQNLEHIMEWYSGIIIDPEQNDEKTTMILRNLLYKLKKKCADIHIPKPYPNYPKSPKV